MFKVDIQGDRVLVESPDPRSVLSLVDASALISELATAIQLASMDEGTVVQPNWRRPGPGVGRAVLPDGRELRVELTEDGWVGFINNERVNGPETRKRDAQRKVERELTKSRQ